MSLRVPIFYLVRINYKSNYYKRKKNCYNFLKKKNLFFTTKVNIKTLDNFLKEKKIDYVEILKLILKDMILM